MNPFYYQTSAQWTLPKSKNLANLLQNGELSHKDSIYKACARISSVLLVLQKAWFGLILNLKLFICLKLFINANVPFAVFILEETKESDFLNVL